MQDTCLQYTSKAGIRHAGELLATGKQCSLKAILRDVGAPLKDSA